MGEGTRAPAHASATDDLGETSGRAKTGLDQHLADLAPVGGGAVEPQADPPPVPEIGRHEEPLGVGGHEDLPLLRRCLGDQGEPAGGAVVVRKYANVRCRAVKAM
jgi:hypothetical protein